MKPKCAVELFLDTLEKSGFDWNNKNVYDMILADRFYPIRKLYDNHKTKKIFPDQMTPTFDGKMLKLLSTKDH